MQVGRNGLHRYNNSDHSMLTAMRAVENICDGAAHDIWAVNADSDYHEEGEVAEQPYRDAPETPAMARPLAAELAALQATRRPTTRVRPCSVPSRSIRGRGEASPAGLMNAIPAGGAVATRMWTSAIGSSSCQAIAVCERNSVVVTARSPQPLAPERRDDRSKPSMRSLYSRRVAKHAAGSRPRGRPPDREATIRTVAKR